MNEYLNIGLIQTTLDKNIAWSEISKELKINELEGERIWNEIKTGFLNFRTLPVEERPKIILLPEFSIDDSHEDSLVMLSKDLGCVVIGGKDFVITQKGGKKYIENKAIVVVPQNWPNNIRAPFVSKFYFGKFFFSNLELESFKTRKYVPKSCPDMYILDAGTYGKIGIAICADFFDIERFVIYKGRIHHLFILAYNQDIHTFYFLAEGISRLVFCNVVVCNSGYYGGSVAFSPYDKSHKRYIYKHEGSKLFTTQVVSLPVQILDDAQKHPNQKAKEFKSAPPAYKQK